MPMPSPRPPLCVSYPYPYLPPGPLGLKHACPCLPPAPLLAAGFTATDVLFMGTAGHILGVGIVLGLKGIGAL